MDENRIRKGDVWFCDKCHQEYITHIKPKFTKKMTTISFDRNKDDINRKHIDQNEDDLEPGEIRDDENENQIAKNCYFWMNTKCKFGKRCTYQHPARCFEQLNIGRCSDRKNCKLVHPKMCKYTYCKRRKCWFNHPHQYSKYNKKIQKFKKSILGNRNLKKWIKILVSEQIKEFVNNYYYYY